MSEAEATTTPGRAPIFADGAAMVAFVQNVNAMFNGDKGPTYAQVAEQVNLTEDQVRSQVTSIKSLFRRKAGLTWDREAQAWVNSGEGDEATVTKIEANRYHPFSGRLTKEGGGASGRDLSALFDSF